MAFLRETVRGAKQRLTSTDRRLLDIREALRKRVYDTTLIVIFRYMFLDSEGESQSVQSHLESISVILFRFILFYLLQRYPFPFFCVILHSI